MSEWTTIESDPGVFTELCEQIGARGVQLEELYTLDQLDALPDVYGLIFLFKWVPEAVQREIAWNAPESLFFAKQVITNACATQAILSILLNLPDDCSKVQIGPILTDLKNFSVGLDPEMKGLTIGNSEVIRQAHNSFHRVSCFEMIQDDDTPKEDAFHFISYVPHKDVVYELDGLKEGPIRVGTCSGTSWLQTAKPEIQQRIERYQQSGDAEIRFNLLALIPNRRHQLEEQVLGARHLIQRIKVKLVSLDQDVEFDDEVDDDTCPPGVPALEDLPEELDSLQAQLTTTENGLATSKAALATEQAKAARWTAENRRRKTDFTPFVLCALKHLARKGKLGPAFEKGKAKAVERQQKKAADKNDKEQTA